MTKDVLRKKKILVVDDEKELTALVSLHMKMAGYEVLTASNGEKALDISREENPDLIILDLMLPKIDGLQVCEQLRHDAATQDIPVIMLTARTQTEDKLKGFEAGADDYVTKPFSPRELIARVKAVLRRAREKEKAPEVLRVGDLAIDFAKIMVSVKNKPVTLTAKEFELLTTLVKAKGRVLSRDYLLDTIWGFDHAVEIQTRTVDVHIRTLRKKLKSASRYIVTVKNYGYRFETEED